MASIMNHATTSGRTFDNRICGSPSTNSSHTVAEDYHRRKPLVSLKGPIRRSRRTLLIRDPSPVRLAAKRGSDHDCVRSRRPSPCPPSGRGASSSSGTRARRSVGRARGFPRSTCAARRRREPRDRGAPLDHRQDEPPLERPSAGAPPDPPSGRARPVRPGPRGSPVRRCVKASVNRMASSTSRRMSVMRASGIRR